AGASYGCADSLLRVVLHAALAFVGVGVARSRVQSFPARRSSDLDVPVLADVQPERRARREPARPRARDRLAHAGASRSRARGRAERKGTRLNTRHVKRSYAVFCPEKKKNRRNGAREQMWSVQ